MYLTNRKNYTAEEFALWLQKFDLPKTTDECITPPEVYNAVLSYVNENIRPLNDVEVLRPFYPGGDYTAEDYTNAVVIDNPPFSIFSKIVDFYLCRDIPFFLFYNGLTVFQHMRRKGLAAIPTNETVTYANGARVNTSFLTNMLPRGVKIQTAVSLAQRLKAITHEATPQRVIHYYPDNVLRSCDFDAHNSKGVDITIREEEISWIRALDTQRERNAQTKRGGKTAIYGSGILVSDNVLKRFIRPERRVPTANVVVHKWTLSEREKEIIKKLK